MILPHSKDAFHKLQLYRLLIAILDSKILASRLYFKGGTCAAMLGWLDRFSVDLDFDCSSDIDKSFVSRHLKKIFTRLNLTVKDQSQKVLQFTLIYPAQSGWRHTLKLGILPNTVKANEYQPLYLPEIDRYAICQTQETMVANKLVAVLDRFEKYGTIAGRDIYDIHYFFSAGFAYKKAVIEQRRKTTAIKYLRQLKTFIEKKVTEKIITQDLSYLLSYDKFKTVRKTLKTETLILLNEEIEKLSFDSHY